MSFQKQEKLKYFQSSPYCLSTPPTEPEIINLQKAIVNFLLQMTAAGGKQDGIDQSHPDAGSVSCELPDTTISTKLFSNEYTTIFGGVFGRSKTPCVVKVTEKSAENEVAILTKLQPLRSSFFPKLLLTTELDGNTALVMSPKGTPLFQLVPYLIRNYEALCVIGGQVIAALLMLHDTLIYHLDLHLNNILWDEDQQTICLIDYDLSTLEPSRCLTLVS